MLSWSVEVTCLYDKFLFIQLHLCITHSGQCRDKQWDVQHPNNHSSQHHVHESIALAHVVILRFSHSWELSTFSYQSLVTISTRVASILKITLGYLYFYGERCKFDVNAPVSSSGTRSIRIFPLILIFWSLTDKNPTLFTTYMSSLCLLSLSLSTTV